MLDDLVKLLKKIIFNKLNLAGSLLKLFFLRIKLLNKMAFEAVSTFKKSILKGSIKNVEIASDLTERRGIV